MHGVVDRETWLQERRTLLAEEKALTKARDRVAAARRSLPWVRVDRDYTFDTAEGKASLAGLFGDLRQLVVYHFMYGPGWEEGCPSCSFWADNFDGVQTHLAARNTAFVAVSRAPLAKLQAFRARMGWGFRWVSSHDTTFNEDFGVSFGEDHTPDAPVTYNFATTTFPSDEAPGISVFAKGDDGEVFHTYSAFARGLDIINGAYAMLDMTPAGRDEADGPMRWLRFHDRYDA